MIDWEALQWLAIGIVAVGLIFVLLFPPERP